MQTITRTVSPVRVSLVTRLRNRLATMFAIMAGFVIVPAAAAQAAPPPSLLGDAEDTFFTTITDFLTGNLLPLVFVLAAVVIGASLLIKYGRKAVSS